MVLTEAIGAVPTFCCRPARSLASVNGPADLVPGVVGVGGAMRWAACVGGVEGKER
jgi:hypothetical protein